MHLNERLVLTGVILFGLGLVAGIAIGSATAVSALTQGAPDVLPVSYTHLTLPTICSV